MALQQTPTPISKTVSSVIFLLQMSNFILAQ